LNCNTWLSTHFWFFLFLLPAQDCVNKYVFSVFVEFLILDIFSEVESNNNEYNLFC
jgi:hypothetical protein